MVCDEGSLGSMNNAISGSLSSYSIVTVDHAVARKKNLILPPFHIITSFGSSTYIAFTIYLDILYIYKYIAKSKPKHLIVSFY